MHQVKQNNAIIEPHAFPGTGRPARNQTHPAKWQEPPALTLDERGMIRDCSESGESLFGYRRHDLTWQHVSKLFPQLSGVALVLEGRVNPMLEFLCHCGHLIRAQNRVGETFPCELSLVHLEHDGVRTLRLIVRPSGNAIT